MDSLIRAILAFLAAFFTARPQRRTAPVARSAPSPAPEPAPSPRVSPPPPVTPGEAFIDGLRAETAAPVDPELIDRIAAEFRINARGLRAVMEVESSGCGIERVTMRPIIRFEAHKFRDFTDGRFDRSHRHLSHVGQNDGGGYVRGSTTQTQTTRWRTLREAASLDLEAALKATSWGRGQVMGFNHQAVGFNDVRAFVQAMCESDAEHVRVMCRFIAGREIDDEINRACAAQDAGDEAGAIREWGAFAYRYNGRNYRVNNYDRRLFDAYARLG